MAQFCTIDDGTWSNPRSNEQAPYWSVDPSLTNQQDLLNALTQKNADVADVLLKHIPLMAAPYGKVCPRLRQCCRGDVFFVDIKRFNFSFSSSM